MAGNKKFISIIDDFAKKLPPIDKKVQVVETELPITVVDLKTFQSNIDEKDTDLFIKQLEDFDYSSLVWQKKKTREYANNIFRLLKSKTDMRLNLSMVQEWIEDDTRKPYLFGYRASKYIGF